MNTQVEVGVEGETAKYIHNCRCCKLLVTLKVLGRPVDFYVHKARLGRVELVFRWSSDPIDQSARFADASAIQKWKYLPVNTLEDKALKEFSVYAHTNVSIINPFN